MIVNNRETKVDEPCFYVDVNGDMHDAAIKNITFHDGNHYADLRFNVDKDGKRYIDVKDVPHNTSPEKNSWSHPRNPEETALHYAPDFYGVTE